MRYRITQTGVRIKAASTSGTPITLQFGDDGTGARHMRLMAEPFTATHSFAYFKMNGSALGTALTVTNADAMVTSNQDVILETRGFTYINVLSPLLTMFINLVPLENG